MLELQINKFVDPAFYTNHDDMFIIITYRRGHYIMPDLQILDPAFYTDHDVMYIIIMRSEFL